MSFIAYLEPKLWLKISILDKNKKVPRKVLFALSRQILASHYSTADWARKVFKPF